LADCVERLLNKKLSNEALQAMGKASFEIAQKFSHADYQEQISSIEI
jgi:hypothetical protein